MQAVPSGSGRLNLGALQNKQLSSGHHGSHASGKALITAALSKMAPSCLPSKKVSSAAMACAPNTLYRAFLLGVLLCLWFTSRMQTC